MAEAFGSPCTESALVNRFKRVVNKDVNAVKAALKAGVDPCTLTLLGVSGKTWLELHFSFSLQHIACLY